MPSLPLLFLRRWIASAAVMAAAASPSGEVTLDVCMNAVTSSPVSNSFCKRFAAFRT
jgi:hypothetical protein